MKNSEDMKTYKKGEIIFRQGEAGESMYNVMWGSVGIYLDYGTSREKKLAELGDESFFGEMGMIDHAPRSATAVALEKTQLMEITEDRLAALFREKPAKVMTIMQHLSNRLRRLTRDYKDACRTAADIGRLDGADAEDVEDVKDRAKRCAAQASGYDALL